VGEGAEPQQQTGHAGASPVVVASPPTVDLEVHEILEAIRHGQIVPHYQPLVALATGRLVGLEALARWERPGYGCLAPAHFVPRLERAHQVTELTAWMLEQACRDLCTWRQRYGVPDDFTVAVNVSATELVDERLVDLTVAALHRYGVPARALCLELTETAAITDLASACRVLAHLRARGVRIAIDDYGAGHATSSYLDELPFDLLKIDQSYVAEFEQRPESLAFIERTVALVHDRPVAIVAEGVQTREQAEALWSLGCLHGQGSGIGHAGPADDVFAAWLPTGLHTG
jgi:EAL domain-containing protein (putative c-di-GMP-specific phosphodiesterase class I)